MAGRYPLTAYRLASKLKAPTIACQSSPLSSQTDRPTLTLGAVTPTLFEKVIASTGNSFNRLTPQQYYARAEKFVELTEQASSVVLVRDSALPPEVVHELGCILCYLSQYTRLSKALWLNASHMGFDPSTISLAMGIVRAECFGELKGFHEVEARFKQLVVEGKNPDALTVEGQRLFMQSDYFGALEVLNRAMRIAGVSDFELKTTCRLHIAKAFLSLDKKTVAMSVFNDVAKTGLAEAHAELGRLLRPTDPVRARQHLYEGAPGRSELYRDLSEMAVEDAASTKGTHHKNLSRWAWEWSRLADRSVEY
ncbi:hypothetical protein L249_2160 [Ophiocordyceps polyrhachis-furcata BCC 54312]|uniref:Uncharacterized protein n=1 Tax=Ophiocordyceps polyrhachis-furcata BCC 54312 TaxID=1330021 RepID=A0A367LRZ5_9HYPO|nr:hypothetical protein L249_2160 [Ophiocordyceps polyrhachis-furcata BCC 54312]